MISKRRNNRKIKKVNSLFKSIENKARDASARMPARASIDIDLSTVNLIPQKIDSKSTHIELSNLMKADIIPCHPFSGLFVGQSGAGKTNTMIYTFNNLYKNYFDEIHVLGQTVKTDAMYQHFNELKKDNIYSDNLESKCNELLNKFKNECEQKGVVNCPKRLIIIEDATSETKLINSNSFVKLYVQARHLNCSIVCNIHKIRSINRSARINAVALFLFKPGASDFQIFVEEYRPPHIDKKTFIEMLNYIFKKSPEMPKPFLYYNRNLDRNCCFRKGFHEIIEL